MNLIEQFLPRVADLLNHKEKQRGCPLLFPLSLLIIVKLFSFTFVFKDFISSNRWQPLCFALLIVNKRMANQSTLGFKKWYFRYFNHFLLSATSRTWKKNVKRIQPSFKGLDVIFDFIETSKRKNFACLISTKLC